MPSVYHNGIGLLETSMVAEVRHSVLVSCRLGPIVGYLGNRYSRPRMMAIGELVLVLSCLINASPYFIYGPGTHLLFDDKLLESQMTANNTRYELCSAKIDTMDCAAKGGHSTIWPAVIILVIGSALRGVGYTAYWVFGVAFIDDSVSKKSSPLYMSLMSILRMIGPAGVDPKVPTNDPRFIGAWWIGFCVIAILLTIVTLPLFLFPRQLKGASVKESDRIDYDNSALGIWHAVIRLLTNPIFMFNMIGNGLRSIGWGGHRITKPKYMESQYRVSGSKANLLTGLSGIVPVGIGILAGGIGIRYIKPRPITLILYMFALEWVSNSVMFTSIFLGCPPLQLGPNTKMTTKTFTMNADCNQGCDCTTSVFTPMCSADSVTTYFSPCYAGCKYMDKITGIASNCSCITDHGGYATSGYCQSDADNCTNFYNYVLIRAMPHLLTSTGRIGSILFALRVIDPKDKTWIPYPMIFGAIADSACLVWESTCGKTGNCWLYDQDRFRWVLHGSALAFMVAGSLFDFGLIAKAGQIKNFYDDDGDKIDDNENDNVNNKIELNSIPIEKGEEKSLRTQTQNTNSEHKLND
ncbi:unnamed protein product, partial [Medioppia subpectinata]